MTIMLLAKISVNSHAKFFLMQIILKSQLETGHTTHKFKSVDN